MEKYQTDNDETQLASQGVAGASAPVGLPSAVSDDGRILALDALRGVAILGILAMNIQYFSQVSAAYLNPAVLGALHGADLWIWFVNHLFFDEKMMAIFSMLYGAGRVLFTSRLSDRGFRQFPVFLRRSLWLFVFGLLHAYLIWSGDILVSYAICGLLVYPLRKLQWKPLLVIGLAVLSISSILFLGYAWALQFMSPAQVKLLEQGVWQPSAQQISAEIAAYRGGWMAQMPARIAASELSELQGLFYLTLWRAGGLMILGMSMFKLGLLTGKFSIQHYRNLALGGLLFGLPLTLYGVHADFADGWQMRYSFFIGSQFNYWGSCGLALSWICLVMIATKKNQLRGVVRCLANAGRMAFSNYILETVICTSIFYGHGLGLFGRLNRIQNMGIVLTIWVLILVLSSVWMKYFYFGPLEWLWRSLTYQRYVSFRRSHLASASASTMSN